MFTLIESNEYCYYKNRIDLLIELMNLHQELPFSYEERACSTFIIGEGLYTYGGAVLLKRHIDDLQSEIKGVVSSLSPNQNYIWTGTLSLCIENKLVSSMARRDEIFYKNLFKTLKHFGKKNNIDLLYLTLNSAEHHRTKSKRLWPYILEINPQDSLDGLFHGLIHLSENNDIAQTYFCQNVDFSSQNGNWAA
jgi:hypothetical protein